MWKATCVQVSTERGTIRCSLGTLSVFQASDGWTITLEPEEVVLEKGAIRLRVPRDLVIVEETEAPDEKPAKRSREAA